MMCNSNDDLMMCVLDCNFLLIKMKKKKFLIRKTINYNKVQIIILLKHYMSNL